MNFLHVAVILTTTATILPAFAEETRSGPATVIDGATLEIAGARTALWGISTTDPATAAGWVAKLYLTILVAGGPISCAPKTPDRWQCLTAEGSDLGSLLVQTGQARAVDIYYRTEEDHVRAASIGLWR